MRYNQQSFDGALDFASKGRRGLDRAFRTSLGVRRASEHWTTRTEQIYGREILSFAESARLLESACVDSPRAFALGRLGGTELVVIRRYVHSAMPRKLGGRSLFGPVIRRDIRQLSGVFPTSTKILDEFAERYIVDIQSLDVLGLWFNRLEPHLAKTYLPASAKLIAGRAIDPLEQLNSDQPWSAGLRDKSVVIVHPFSESISRQFEKRQLLHKNPETLPPFKIETITAVQSLGGTNDWKNWHSALASMEEKITNSSCEIVLIGAGAYGLPLAAAAKRAGKVGIQVGGCLQMLFGILGRRWENNHYYSTIVNDEWTRPQEVETPKVATKVEGGAYW